MYAFLNEKSRINNSVINFINKSEQIRLRKYTLQVLLLYAFQALKPITF